MLRKVAKIVFRRARWAIPILVAVFLFFGGHLLQQYRERNPNGSDLQYAAFAALGSGNPSAAYALFIESAAVSDDPAVRSVSLYNAANIAWFFELADYNTLVELYKESLRSRPGFYQASWNLELLYFLKSQAPEMLPVPGDGEFPGEEEYVPTGDV